MKKAHHSSIEYHVCSHDVKALACFKRAMKIVPISWYISKLGARGGWGLLNTPEETRGVLARFSSSV